MAQPVRAKLVTLLKLGVVAGALYYLIGQNKLDVQLRPGGSVFIGASFLMLLMACMISFYRYYLLVRCLKIDLTLADSARIGLIGGFFNTFMPGSLGGDVIRLGYVFRETGMREPAVASVIVDRVIGLLGLVAVGGLAMLLNWDQMLVAPDLRRLGLVVFAGLWTIAVSAVAGFVALAAGRRRGLLAWLASSLLTAALGWWALRSQGLEGVSQSAIQAFAAPLLVPLGAVLVLPSCQPGRRLYRLLGRLPAGSMATGMLDALLLFRHHKRVLLVSLLMSATLQAIAVVGLYLAGRALAGTVATLVQVFFAGPVAMVINVLPVSFGGLGVGESAMYKLLGLCRSAQGEPLTHGASMFLMYRVALVGVGLVGLPLYLRGRKEIDAVRQQAAEAEGLDSLDAAAETPSASAPDPQHVGSGS